MEIDRIKNDSQPKRITPQHILSAGALVDELVQLPFTKVTEITWDGIVSVPYEPIGDHYGD